MLHMHEIDKSWTLFLDRDGVINYEKEKDYIHTWDQFRFYPGVTDSFRVFSKKFHRIIIVTNQKGVGKGLTKLEDLHTIHANMQHEIEKAGGHIDAVFYCSDLDNESPYRKPNPGMGLQAAKQFPDINLKKSIMVGNNLSDMEFGRNLGMFTVFLKTTNPALPLPDERIDIAFTDLCEFTNTLQAETIR